MKDLKLHAFWIIFFLVSACKNNTKLAQDNRQPISIHKIWHFKKMGTSSNHTTTPWVGNNRLDMRKKDTLQFSYDGMHNKPTAYPYRILHDTIFIQHKPGYKIVKLTDSGLYLEAIFGRTKAVIKDSTVMIYSIK